MVIFLGSELSLIPIVVTDKFGHDKKLYIIIHHDYVFTRKWI